MAQSRLARLQWPLLILVVLVVPSLFYEDLLARLGVELIGTTIKVLSAALYVSLWLAMAWLCVRLLDVFFWQGLIADRLGGQAPKLLKDVIAVLIFAIAITGILGMVFDLDVTGLWATSGVLTLVVGFAIQSMIADVFSGIALNIDRPFRIGEWVKIQRRGFEPVIGRVEEVNWRSTRVWQTDGTLVIVPNSVVATTVLTNLSQPDAKSRFELHFCLDFGVPKERALRILLAGVKAAKGPLKDPAPKVRVNGVTNGGVDYEVRYWLNPAEVSPSKGRHAVAGAILEHLHHAGLTLAYNKQDLYVASMPPRQLDTQADKSAIVGRVDLFADLDDQEMKLLAEQLFERSFAEATEVVRHGEEGDSMYVLVEGLLHVYAPTDNGHDVLVAQLEPGDFFGEMSLLTGEPRSATVRSATSSVVYEITKEHLTVLLDRRPEIAEEIARIVAERRMRTAAQQEAANKPEGEHEEEARGFAQQLLGKMRGIFASLNKKNGSRTAPS